MKNIDNIWAEYDNLSVNVNLAFEAWSDGHIGDFVDSINQCPEEIMWALAGETDEKSESVPVRTECKLSRKSRRAVRIDCNKRKKGADRAHGKHARNIRKAIWEDTADWDDMPNNTYYRWDDKRKTFSSPKMPKVHRVKRTFRDRMDCATRDRLNDISPIERLTASVLAEVKQYHGMVGWTDNVFYLAGAICRREQLPYPDYAYVHEFRGKVELVLEYFDSYDDEEYSTYERINLR